MPSFLLCYEVNIPPWRGDVPNLQKLPVTSPLFLAKTSSTFLEGNRGAQHSWSKHDLADPCDCFLWSFLMVVMLRSPAPSISTKARSWLLPNNKSLGPKLEQLAACHGETWENKSCFLLCNWPHQKATHPPQMRGQWTQLVYLPQIITCVYLEMNLNPLWNCNSTKTKSVGVHE